MDYENRKNNERGCAADGDKRDIISEDINFFLNSENSDESTSNDKNEKRQVYLSINSQNKTFYANAPFDSGEDENSDDSNCKDSSDDISDKNDDTNCDGDDSDASETEFDVDNDGIYTDEYIFPTFREPSLNEECKIEFVDWKFLNSECIDNHQKALEYFYLSPFYERQKMTTLNELMRTGQQIDLDHQTGTIFTVTYDNMSYLKDIAPENMFRSDKNNVSSQWMSEEEVLEFGQRCLFFSNQAIFHISLIQRELGAHGTLHKYVRKLYIILAGKIYRVPPIIDVLQQKMCYSMIHFDKAFDIVNGRLNSWNSLAGYAWTADVDEGQQQRLKKAADIYLNKDNSSFRKANVRELILPLDQFRQRYALLKSTAMVRVLEEHQKKLQQEVQRLHKENMGFEEKKKEEMEITEKKRKILFEKQRLIKNKKKYIHQLRTHLSTLTKMVERAKHREVKKLDSENESEHGKDAKCR